MSTSPPKLDSQRQSTTLGDDRSSSTTERKVPPGRVPYDVPPAVDFPRATSFTTPPPVYNSDIPAGWERRFDSWGREYFINHRKKTTQWNHPLSRAQEASVAPLFTPFADAPYRPPPAISLETVPTFQTAESVRPSTERLPSLGDAYATATPLRTAHAGPVPETPQQASVQTDQGPPDSALSTQAESLPVSGPHLTPHGSTSTPTDQERRDEEIARSMQLYYARKTDEERLRAAKRSAKRLGVDLTDVPGISDLETEPEDEAEHRSPRKDEEAAASAYRQKHAGLISGIGFGSVRDNDLDSTRAFEEASKARGFKLGSNEEVSQSPGADLAEQETSKMDIGEPGFCAILGDTLQHNKCLAISSLFVWVWVGPFIGVVKKAMKEGLSAEVLFISVLFVVPALSYVVFFILYPLACGDRESPGGDHIHEFMRESAVTPLEAAETIEALRNAQPSLELRVQCYSGDSTNGGAISDSPRIADEDNQLRANRRVSFERTYPIRILRWYDVSPSSLAYLDALESSPAILSSVTYHKVFRLPPGQEELIQQVREELYEIHRHRDDYCDVDLVYLILNARAPYLIRRFLDEDSDGGKAGQAHSSSSARASLPAVSPRRADPEGAYTISDDYDEGDLTNVFSRNISKVRKPDLKNASWTRRFLTWFFINRVALWIATITSLKLPYLVLWKRLVRPFRYYDVKILEVDRNNPVGPLQPMTGIGIV